MSDEINKSLETLFSNMENFISSKTVVGEAIHIDGVTILPLVDVNFGVAAGSASKSSNGGGGLGAKITPSAVLVIEKGNVQLVSIKNQDSINKLIDMAPGVLSKLNFGPFKKKEESSAEKAVKEVKLEETIITEPLE